MSTIRTIGAVMLLSAAAWGQSPLGTAFTYQGQLKLEGVPVSDTADFQFTPFDAAVGGNQLAPVQTVSGVIVSGGLFTVTLDFGADLFNGDACWLQIRVRVPSGSGELMELSPRQPLTAAPYALQTRGLFVDDQLRVGLGTTTPANRLHAVDDDAGFVVSVENTKLDAAGGGLSVACAGPGSRGINAECAAATGSGIGVRGFSAGATGIGVRGEAVATSDINYGGYFLSKGRSGRGIYAWADAAAGTTFGVLGQSDSTSGSGLYGLATASSGQTYGVYGQSSSTSGRGVTGVAGATSGTTYGVYGRSDSTSGRAVFGTATADSGTTYAGRFECDSSDGWAGYFDGRGYFSANVGLGTLTPEARLHVEGADNQYLVRIHNTNATYGPGLMVQSDGSAIVASSTAASGAVAAVIGRSDSASGHGVYGEATAADGTNYGVRGISSSTEGRGVSGLTTASTGLTCGVYGESDSTTGRGVFGRASATTGATFGGRFENSSTAGIAVIGLATAETGYPQGGVFHTYGTSGTGAAGLAWATSGAAYGLHGKSNSPTGRGVYGEVTAHEPTDSPYGVRGYCSTATVGFAVYANGDLGANGTKSFRIDHPSDPENKYLLHYSVESPEVLNTYCGKVTLDERGQAVVQLPAYFASINKDPRYTLTAVGAPMPTLHVAEEISAEALQLGEQAGPGVAPPTCSFRIAGGAAGAKVSWEVKAVRNDLRMRLHGAPVERNKHGPERGTYEHPEYYGQPPEMGMDYDAMRERSLHETQSDEAD